MNNITKIEDRKILESMDYKDIRKIILKKLTKEDNENLSKITDAESRKMYMIELYYRYIDQIIAESNAPADADSVTKTDETGETTTVVENPTVIETEEEKKAAEEKEKIAATISAAQKTELSTNVDPNTCISVVLRGTPDVNGKCSISIQKLILVLVRNKGATVVFSKKERAKQFIEMLKTAKSVKGVYALTEPIKERIINMVKSMNKL